MFRYAKHFLAALFCCISAAAQAYIKPQIQVRHWYTANQIPVYFVATTELPILDLKLAFAAGSARDAQQPGLAYLSSKMLFNQSGNTAFEQNRARFSSSVNRDKTVFHLRAVNQTPDIHQALKLFAAIFSAPDLSARHFQTEKRLLANKIQKEADSMKYQGEQNLYKALYVQHPYAHAPLGSVQNIQRLQPRDIKNFYRQYYVASNAVMSIVGNITEQRAREIAEIAARQIPAGKPAPALPLAQDASGAILKVAHSSTQVHLFIGQIGITPTDPAYFPLIVGNQILGGGALISRLGEELRLKRGLTYSVSSHFYPLAARGPFIIKLQTHHRQAEQACQLVQKVISQFVTNGPTTDELNAAKQKLLGNFPIQFDSNEEIVDQLLEIGFYHLPLDYFNRYQDKINAVTAEQVTAAFQRHINPAALTTVIVGGHE